MSSLLIFFITFLTSYFLMSRIFALFAIYFLIKQEAGSEKRKVPLSLIAFWTLPIWADLLYLGIFIRVVFLLFFGSRLV